MKKILLILCFIFSPFFIFAGPFGLSMGMNFAQITEACGGNRPERIENDDRYFIIPDKKHSTFIKYIAWIDDEHGLYRIRGISDSVTTDKYGREIQNMFYNFEERVEAIYGKPELTDKLLDRSSLYEGDSEWSYSLREGARELSAIWSSEITGKKLKDDISYVNLFVMPYIKIGYTFVLIIDYEFENATKVEENEDSVL